MDIAALGSERFVLTPDDRPRPLDGFRGIHGHNQTSSIYEPPVV
jgi:hypothetical protein